MYAIKVEKSSVADCYVIRVVGDDDFMIIQNNYGDTIDSAPISILIEVPNANIFSRALISPKFRFIFIDGKFYLDTEEGEKDLICNTMPIFVTKKYTINEWYIIS